VCSGSYISNADILDKSEASLYVLFAYQTFGESREVTSLRKRFDNVLAELDIIRSGLNNSGEFPPCCLTLYGDGKLGCDINGPLPPEVFLKECIKCRKTIRRFLEQIEHSIRQDNFEKNGEDR